MPKNGSPSRSSMIAWSAAADLPDVDRGVPRADRREVGPNEPIDVVADRRRQLAGLLHDEPGAARQRAPDPERPRERVAALDPPVAGAEQAETRPRPGSQHEVARERPAVPAEQATASRSVMPRRSPTSSVRMPLEVWQPAHSSAAICSASLMTRSPSAGSINRSVALRPRCCRRPTRGARRPGTPARRCARARRTSSSRRCRRVCPYRSPPTGGSPPAAGIGPAAGSAG